MAKEEKLPSGLVNEVIKFQEDIVIEARQKDRMSTIDKLSKTDISKASVEELRAIVQDLYKIVAT